MLRSIVVPLDGSPLSARAIPVAAALARQHESRIHLVQVLPATTPAAVVGLPPTDAATDLENRRTTERSLARTSRRTHKATRLDVVPHLRIGDTVDEIDSAVRELGAELIVMTTHGRGGIARAWMGSVAESVLRHATVPVLVLRQRLDLTAAVERGVPFARVVVAVDGTPESEDVIGDVSRLLPEAPLEIVLVHAVNPSPAVALEQGSLDTVQRLYLEPLAAKYRDARRTVRTQCVNANNVARAIVEAAEAEQADLIAIRTGARRGFARWVVGSVADKIVRLAQVPVYLRVPGMTDVAPGA